MSRILRWGVPLVVSGGTLAFLLWQIDFREALHHVDATVAGTIVPALLLYGAVSLVIEALSLARVTHAAGSPLTRWTCARIKAASYPLAIVHYALGVGGLTYLLRRHGALSISRAAGVVGLIGFFDLGLLLAVTALGAGLLATQAPEVRASLVVAVVGAILAGLAVLRTRRSFGSLDRLRDLELFRAARAAPAVLLLEVAVLRLLFVLVFIGLAAVSLVAFGIHVPLGDLVVCVTGIALVSALPIAIAGLGTGQVAFVYLLRHWGEPEVLLACSLVLSAGLIGMRAALGLLFAREFTREALVHAAEG
ncbi:MAG: lysylphosphatidylglycerol synthase domain-containing protein [Myxococcota bacterium]